MTRTQTAFAATLIVLIPVVNYLCTGWHSQAWAWTLTAILMLAFTMTLGQGIVGRCVGALIDDRNVMSLSRFQMFLWTTIVLSAYIAAAFFNILAGGDDPLSIGIPSELWIAMGISTTSLVGTPLILGQKKNKQADPAALQDTKDQLLVTGFNPLDVKATGQIIGNARPDLASWSDMFTGDETSNGAHIDLSKLQMFFFTLLIAFSYCYALWKIFSSFAQSQSDGIHAFPTLDQSTIALLAISHSGYLVSKAVPRQ